MRSTFGKSLGIAVQGIMPEVYRNRPKADPADRTGQPWPDAVTDGFDTATFDGDGMLTGDSDTASLAFTLPSLGVWLLVGGVQLSGAVLLANEIIRAEIELQFDIGSPPLRIPIGTNWTTGGFSFALAENLQCVSLTGFAGMTAGPDVTFLASTNGVGNTADWDDVDVHFTVLATRLGSSPL